MELEQIYEVLKDINGKINRLTDWNGDVIRDIDLPTNATLDDKFNRDTALSILSRLSDIKIDLDWLHKPILAQGYLLKNENGRYKVKGQELTSGHPLDYYDKDFEEWKHSRVEHNGDDYYIYHYGRERSIEGLLVRIR